MGLNVGGGSDLSAVMVGTTPVKDVYVGNDHVWPTGPVAPPERVRGYVFSGGAANELPPHNPGDMIVVIASSSSQTGAPLTPTAEGDVPPWTTVGTWYEDGFMGMTIGYTIATTSTHMSGYWEGSTVGYIFVTEGQAADPIGDVQVTLVDNWTRASLPITCPAVTLQDTSGNSELVHFVFGFSGVSGSGSGWLEGTYPPPGYVGQDYATEFDSGAAYSRCFLTKEDTTSDGEVVVGDVRTGSTITSWGSGSIEIKFA